MSELFVDWEAVGASFSLLSSDWHVWFWILPGLIVGLVSGALPGVGSAVAISVLLPVTYSMDFLSAVVFLTAIFTGSGFGASVPAILINVPGSPAATATCFDGYPMAKMGKHNEALGVALFTSAIATAFSYALLFLFIQPASAAVLKLGPTEMLLVVVWGLILIATLTGQSMLRGLVSGGLGILISTIGFSLTGAPRGTFGLPQLYEGVSVIAAMVGLFGGAEMLRISSQNFIVENAEHRKLTPSRIFYGFKLALKSPAILLQGSIIGAVIGIVPGVGSSVANLVSYERTRLTSADRSSFGKGNPHGVIAAESANSSSEGGSMATLLALGIPGSGGTALLLGAFSIHGVAAGPRYFTENKDVVYAIILNNIVQTFLLILVGALIINICASLVRVSNKILVPAVLSIAMVGSYSVTNSMAGPITFILFSGLGWMMRRYGYSLPAMVIGMFLGANVESEAVRSLQISAGKITYILDRPVSMILLLLIIIPFLWPMVKKRLFRRTA